MPHMRGRAYDLGAFQPDMHARQDHHFSGQSLSMFLTYGFLHTGLSHLIANMLGLVWMGKLILFYRTPATFLMFYLVCLVGGAQAYLVLYTQGGVMVGASGAVFGLLGVYAVDSGLFRSSRPRPEEAGVQFFRVSMATVLLALGEVGGQKLLGSSPMAWQAHAGGFLTGAVAALLMPPRLRDRQ
ncbi:rhomboid family intramembrane serine protease [Rhodobacteraceae bacterium KMM 6894]|nr:rhomboid family intramembrane serine protease [Rhodobacteraceae bacterium KMM 6894]